MKPVDYSFGVGKEIADFIRHQLSDYGPYGIQFEVSKVGGRFKKPSFKCEVFTEDRNGKRLHKCAEFTFDDAAICHITDIAESFRFDFK